ncbi:rhodanese-like domain-containing protein [Rhodococcus erythropolis]|uniref:rhodanese-like domain-containing protein n=1 Tax=Rhodococcus erythropolis TaxID=1833 RepID=UPI00087857A6|nr:rhodanese-like domain-containing protein [Rhodococcus erythropolis]OFV79063.1 thiosulfate sulfurtransferase GlpE [Rhodococcus erythropolis]
MTGAPPEADPAAAHALIAESGAILIDVREDDEWAAGHAPAAVHVPLGSLDPSDYTPDRTLVVVCRSGARSSKAAMALAAAGRTAHNLIGGMKAWHEDGRPVVRDDGTPGAVI